MTFVLAGIASTIAALAVLDGIRLWVGGLLIGPLLFAAAVDARARLLPDWPALLLASGGVYLSLGDGVDGLGYALAGGFLAGAGLFIIGRAVAIRAGRDALGMGDVKYTAAGGVLLGPLLIWTALAAAATATLAFVFVGAILARRPLLRLAEIPLGPALLGAIWTTWLVSEAAKVLPHEIWRIL